MGSLLQHSKTSLQWIRVLSTLCNNIDSTKTTTLDKTLVDKINGLYKNMVPLDQKVVQKDFQKNVIDKDVSDDDSNIKMMNDRYD
jgi:hypothetical protein